MTNFESLFEKHGEVERSELRFVDIDEIKDGEKPVRIYFRPMTLWQQNRIYKYVKAGDLESLAETIIVRSLTAEGDKMFTEAYRSTITRKWSPRIIYKITDAMSKTEQTIEEAEKN